MESESRTTRLRQDLLRPFVRGLAFGAGLLASGLLAVTISGTINSFSSGETISAATINENFASLKTAVEGIPTITESGSSSSGYTKIGTTIIAWGSGLCSAAGATFNLPVTMSDNGYVTFLFSTNQAIPAETQYGPKTTNSFHCQVTTGTPLVNFLVVGK